VEAGLHDLQVGRQRRSNAWGRHRPWRKRSAPMIVVDTSSGVAIEPRTCRSQQGPAALIAVLAMRQL